LKRWDRHWYIDTPLESFHFEVSVMSRTPRRRLLGAGILIVASIEAALSEAGQIALSAFGPAASTQTFEVLGPGSREYATPTLIGTDQYDADGHILDSSSKFGPAFGRSGVAISNNRQKSGAAEGFLDIVFGTPALRAGGFVGYEFPWSVKVEFYNTQNELVGSITAAGVGGDNRFTGWEADSGTIGRVLVVDTLNTVRSGIFLDDFIQEAPEPSVRWGLVYGIVLNCLWCRRVAQRRRRS
jgi:hypothetical protein